MSRTTFKAVLISGLLSLLCPQFGAAMDCSASTIHCVARTPGPAQEYATIQACANAARPGDTCAVSPGTYDERVILTKSGSEAAGYINFVGNAAGTKAVMRGFDVGASYIRIIGFEITHDSRRFSRAVVFTGTRTRIEILDNYIHHVHNEGGAIRAMNSTISHVLIRGNEIDYAGCVPGVACAGNGWAAQAASTSSHWLIEYNQFRRLGDFVNLYGQNHIVRNNYMHDFRNSHFPDGPGSGLHADFFQPGSDGPNSTTNHHVYESNTLGDNVELNSHILQMRNSGSPNSQYEFIYRGNVAYNLGSYALMARGVHRVRHYNNVFHRMNQLQSQRYAFDYNPEGQRPSLAAHNFNNIISETGGRSGGPISISGGSTLTASHNICYRAGTHTSCVSLKDPLFTDPALADFTLRPDSPAIDTGRPITIVTGDAGTGNSFDTADAAFFTDGYGIVEGDMIKVGANPPVRITSINSKRITVEREISWNNGDGVFWRNQDASPDIGAYEYRKQGYNMTLTLNHKDGDRIPLGAVNIKATVNDSSLVRFVEFRVNGIPVSTDFDSPYEHTWDASSQKTGSKIKIQAIARPLHASTVLGTEDSATITLGPSGLRQ